MALSEILSIIWITFLPFLELRASIPYGIVATELHWSIAFLVAVLANILLGIVLYFALGKIAVLIKKIPSLNNPYNRYVERTQKKIRPLVEKYGEWALAVFIGIPLPGTGVYSGALAGYLLGMPFKNFFVSTVAGVLIAGILVLLVSLTGIEAFRFFLKPV